MPMLIPPDRVRRPRRRSGRQRSTLCTSGTTRGSGRPAGGPSMRVTSWGRALVLGCLAPAVLAVLAACGGEPGGTTAAWKYDEAASADRIGDSPKEAQNMKRLFHG